MVEVAEPGDRRPVGEDKRMNANYHGKGSQLCYCLPLLCVCTLHQCQNEQQKTTGFITGAWLFGPLCSVYDGDDHTGVITLNEYSTPC